MKNKNSKYYILFFLILFIGLVYFVFYSLNKAVDVRLDFPEEDNTNGEEDIKFEPEPEESVENLPPETLPETVDIVPEKVEEEVVEFEEEEKAVPEESENKDNTILLSVPFVSQAPLGDWSDPRQQDGCEEASVLMAIAWTEGRDFITTNEALETIILISDYELEKYGSFHDTSASSTVERIFNDYFDYDNVQVQYDIAVEDIIAELQKGNLVIAPFDGQKLNNIYYTPPGAERHMLVIIGYDFDTNEFITNDPGTKRGAGYRYPRDILFSAIRDYPTGNHLPILGTKNAIIRVEKL